MVAPHCLDAAGAMCAQTLMKRPCRVEVAEDGRSYRSRRQRRRTAEDTLASAAHHVTA
jgi:hypothetical protein